MTVSKFAVSPNKEVFLRIVLKYAEVIEKCEQPCSEFLLTDISEFLLVNQRYLDGPIRSALAKKYRDLMLVDEKYKKYYTELFGDIKDDIHNFGNIRECIQTELESLTVVSHFKTEERYNKKGEFHHTHGPAIVRANGDKEWWVNGKRHRTDGPATERVSGTKEWYQNDKLHRTDGPAIEWANGDTTERLWYQHGELHRTDGPAIEWANGDTTERLWYQNGERHRTDGPAIEWANGDTTERLWYQNGERHRTDGPAIEWANGDKEWYIDDKRHRTGGPAIEFLNGDKEWYFEGKNVEPMFHECKVDEEGTRRYYNEKGQLHHTHGPAVVYSDGDKAWYQHGELHRTDGPAVEWANGDRWWYLNGKLHRTDGPAIECADGYKAWWQNGERHRTDGPARDWPKEGIKEWYFEGQRVEPMFHECKVDEEGTRRYFNEKGQLHRTHGPAVVFDNGLEWWCLNGKLIDKTNLLRAQPFEGVC